MLKDSDITTVIEKNSTLWYHNNDYHYQNSYDHAKEIETEGSYYQGVKKHLSASFRGMDIRKGKKRNTQRRTSNSLPQP